MNTYRIRVLAEVEVSAYSPEDAVDVIEETFGDTSGLEVQDLEIQDIQEL